MGEKIDDHRQRQPALLGTDIVNIGYPDLICPDDGKLSLYATQAMAEDLQAIRHGAF